MYLQKLTLRNIKNFSNFEINFISADNQIRRWTTILGPNGVGKSTLLRAIGAALAGPKVIRELLPVTEGWVRKDHAYGEIEAEIMSTKNDAQVSKPRKTPYKAKFIVTGDDIDALPNSIKEFGSSVLEAWSGNGDSKARESHTKDMNQLKLSAYEEGRQGWLACGYGPFRRLSGGSESANEIIYSKRRSARFVTLFKEDAALTDTENWLKELHNTSREGDSNSATTLSQIRKALESNLLPEPVTLEISAGSVKLKINQSPAMPLRDLSDGYRSMLALALDLIRCLSSAYPNQVNLMQQHGVVLIDEIDAHAHPTWQRQMGYWLLDKFPNIQFIVATHSPFIAQVAENGGNIILVLTEQGSIAQTQIDDITDWRTDEIYTEVMNLPNTRSLQVQKKLKRLTALLQKKQEASLLLSEEKILAQLTLWAESLSPAIPDRNKRRVAIKNHQAVIANQAALLELE